MPSIFPSRAGATGWGLGSHVGQGEGLGTRTSSGDYDQALGGVRVRVTVRVQVGVRLPDNSVGRRSNGWEALRQPPLLLLAQRLQRLQPRLLHGGVMRSKVVERRQD